MPDRPLLQPASPCVFREPGEAYLPLFVCGAHGNQLDLWAAATKQSLFDAAVDLCHRAAVEVPWMYRW